MQTKRKPQLSSKAGQATVEYLVVAVGVLIAIMALTVGSQEQCIAHFSGTTSAQECHDLSKAVTMSLRKSVEEITFLINLPL